MAAWLLPAVKVILPYLSSIVAAAMPVFTTRKNAEMTAAEAQLRLQQQIAELQFAASQNAVHIKELAEQLQKITAALEQGASLAESRFRRTAALCIGAIVVSLIALCVSLIALFGR